MIIFNPSIPSSISIPPVIMSTTCIGRWIITISTWRSVILFVFCADYLIFSPDILSFLIFALIFSCSFFPWPNLFSPMLLLNSTVFRLSRPFSPYVLQSHSNLYEKRTVEKNHVFHFKDDVALTQLWYTFLHKAFCDVLGNIVLKECQLMKSFVICTHETSIDFKLLILFPFCLTFAFYFVQML